MPGTTPHLYKEDPVTNFLARARVIATSAVTYILFAQTACYVVADEVAKVAPDQAESIAEWALKAAAAGGAVVRIIRRVSPVDPAHRGILPK
jgi:hypothetical protein